jgi:hypothetical protein
MTSLENQVIKDWSQIKNFLSITAKTYYFFAGDLGQYGHIYNSIIML